MAKERELSGNRWKMMDKVDADYLLAAVKKQCNKVY